MSQVDRVLDADPGQNHAFLQATERLVKLKEQNPRVRLSGSAPLRETVVVAEEDNAGVRAPKRSFMELGQYEKRFGPAPAHKIKSLQFRGKTLRGVDIVKEEDASCHD